MSTKQEKEKEINNHFLIVDDQEQIATMQAMILIRNGYKNIYTVNSGRKALSMLKQFPIDFIITDWHMPNMSGIELLISIRKNQQYQNIPVLMLTEEMSQEKVIYAIEEGVDGYQEKPFSEKAMLKAIQNIFYKKSHPNALQSQRQRLLCLQLQKKYDEALSLATEILNTSESIDALFVSSECYFYKKQLKRAKSYIQKALKIKQEGKFLNLLGKIYMAEEKPEYKSEEVGKNYALFGQYFLANSSE